ncbi:MAG TPA: peptidase S10 [Deltaproteobacteria bacterium]|nr:peptidase S10 [Deltaproteobacteria bacterium]
MAREETSSVVVVSTASELKQLLGKDPDPRPAPDTPPDRAVISEHEVMIAGQRVPYTATCGTLPVRLDDRDKPKEHMFYTAYVRSDVEERHRRPLTFCFNGGPGSSSVWLHMGCFGPRRVRVDVDARPRPPARAEDHPHSLLDVTDLVFVDPVGTGFSRPEHDAGKDYHEVEGDVQAMAEFIRRYVTAHARWESPKFVAGESYGTTRAAALATHLQERHGLFLNGLILLSVALQFQTLEFDEGNDLPYALYLPAYAMIAAYHGRIEADDLDALRLEVEAFSLERYTPALMRGSRLSEADAAQLAEELARFTGLDADFVRRCNHRIHLGRFCRELLRDSRETVGRLDARFTGHGADAAGESLERDPSMAALFSAYTPAFLHDLRTRLGYGDDESYELLSSKTHEAWRWSRDNRYLDVTGALRAAMIDNPHLGVFVASGLYDLATPYWATEHTLSHLGLEPATRAHITHVLYPAGHMMYIHEPSMEALRGDLLRFYEAWS